MGWIMPVADTRDRDFEIWKRHARGKRMKDLATEFGISISTVWAAIERHRATITPETREQLIQKEVDWLQAERERVLQLFDAAGVPVTVGREGEYLTDPETGEVVRDHTGRLNAVRTACQMTDLLAKLTGAYAPTQVNVTASEEAAAQAAAEEAVGYVAGKGANS